MAGRYYITKQLARGPVSDLFLALDATDKSGKVTEFHLVKFHPEYCAREGFVSALEGEAFVELGLNHPNILKLCDFGTWEGLCFLVYEKNPSLSLAEALAIHRTAGKSVEILQVASTALQLLDALIYSHALGEGSGGRKPPIFQSGFSPDSVEISSSGQVKVRSFTRASVRAAARPNLLDMALGRISYLAPTIRAGQSPSPTADLYSLGSLLWELLVGQPLPMGNDGDGAAPPVFSLRPDVPRELDSFLSKLLAGSPDLAFRSASEAKVALEKALFTLSAKVSPKDIASWHRQLRKLDARAGLKEDREGGGGERNVIAEVVASRKLKVLSEEVESNEPVVASASVSSPKEVAKPAGPAWNKSVSFKEIPETETAAEDLSAKLEKKKKIYRYAFSCAAAVLLVAASAFFYLSQGHLLLMSSSDVLTPVPAKPRELLAVFAYEDSGTVTVQGVRNENTKSFAHGCGEIDRPCFCDYLLAPDDTAASLSVEGVFSAAYNLVSCPQSTGTHKFVRVTSKEEGAKSSNAVLIRNALNWRQALGPDLMKTRVRWVSQFACDRSFFEGEGVSATGELSCLPVQKLSILSATFQYYSFRSEEDGEKEEAIPVDTDAVCGNMNLSKYRCLDGSRNLLFGLYKNEEAPFTIPVSLKKAPREGSITVFGFAAEPDRNGLCPTGLMKVRQWTASPPTLSDSTFVNDNAHLSNRVFDSQEPRAFTLSRQKNRSPCDGRGNCSFATFEDPAPAQSTPYSAGVDICVLPPSMVSAAAGDEENLPGAVKERAFEALVRISTKIPGYEVLLNGKKVLNLKDDTFFVPLHQEHKVEVLKQGFLTQRFVIPPREKTSAPFLIEAAAVEVKLGSVDLASFPPSEAAFYRGDEMVFTGPTPVAEKLPVGKYRVTLTDRTGNVNEISVTVVEGKVVSVDHLMKKTQ